MKTIMILTCLLVLFSCQKIERGETLDQETIAAIKSMKLLDENETIIQYYSNYSKDKAGNFFTDKRIAHYWLDSHDNSKTDISFAYYQDIVGIDTTFVVTDFDISYMTVRKRDSTSFRVYIDGSHDEQNVFFTDAMKLWKRKR